MIRTLIALIIFSLIHIPLLAGPLESGTPQEKIDYMESLVQRGEKPNTKTIKALSWLLANPEEAVLVRERAAWTLGQLQIRSEVVGLITACKNKSLLIRSAALDALMHWRAKTALSTYVEMAETDPVLSMRVRATLALGLTRSDKAIDPLLKLSEDEFSEVRGASCLAMGAVHSIKNSFIEILNEMTKDKDPYVKDLAKLSLDVANRKNQVVLSHLESSNSDVRLFSAYFFHKYGNNSDLSSLKTAVKSENNNEVRFELQQAVKAIGKRTELEKKRAEEERIRREAEEKKEAERAASQIQ